MGRFPLRRATLVSCAALLVALFAPGAGAAPLHLAPASWADGERTTGLPLDGQTPGAQLWAQRYDGPVHSHDYATSVGVSPDGTTVYVTGLSYQFGPEPEIADYATIA